ncbi:MAG: LPS export ABC transporter periplasmic protein LptC [Burkholderiales bacterium]
MNGRISIALPLALLAVLAFATFWLEQQSQPQAAVANEAPKHEPDTIVSNFSAARMDAAGRPDYTLSATKMFHYPDNDSTRLSAPRLSHFEPGKPPIHVRSDEGLVSKDGGHVYFQDDVEVTREARDNQSQLTLTTDFLHVIPEENLAKTPKPVVISNDELRLTGVGMELNSETHKLELHAKVKGRYEARKKK